MVEKALEYDENGKLKYYLDETGLEQWWEYYDNGKLKHHKTSRGDERYLKYGSKGGFSVIYIHDFTPHRGHEWFIYFEYACDLISISKKDYEEVENEEIEYEKVKNGS